MVDTSSSPLLAGDVTRIIIGAFYDTYNELGPGFPEFIARRALGIKIRESGLTAVEEVTLPVWFLGHRIARFEADLVVAEKVIVEVKISPEIQAFHKAQVLHYLKATDLLVNFGREPHYKRVVYENSRKRRYFEPPSSSELEREFQADPLDDAG